MTRRVTFHGDTYAQEEKVIWEKYSPKIGSGIKEKEELERKNITQFEACRKIE